MASKRLSDRRRSKHYWWAASSSDIGVRHFHHRGRAESPSLEFPVAHAKPASNASCAPRLPFALPPPIHAGRARPRQLVPLLQSLPCRNGSLKLFCSTCSMAMSTCGSTPDGFSLRLPQGPPACSRVCARTKNPLLASRDTLITTRKAPRQ